jgi:hypothetical protein
MTARLAAAIAATGAMLLGLAHGSQPSGFQPEDVLARSRVLYGSLRSYADTGTVDVEFGPRGAVVRERHTFKTSYRSPRHFYFDFTKHQDVDRFVVWGDDEGLHTWWRTTGVENSYPRGQGITAFVTGSVPTKNSLHRAAALPERGVDRDADGVRGWLSRRFGRCRRPALQQVRGCCALDLSDGA